MDREQAVITRFWQQQENYMYYIIGISIAAIGFVIVNTKEEQFAWILIPAGLSVICWALSIYSGLRFVKYLTSTLYTNAELLKVQKGEHPLTGRNPKKMQIGETELKKMIKKNETAVKKLGDKVEYFFYSGIVLYLIYHLIVMYNNAPQPSYDGVVL